MKSRFQLWQLVVAMVAVCAAALWFAHWKRTSHRLTAQELIQCLPQDRSTHLYIDVDALRQAGILNLLIGSRADEDPDYRQFVQQTGFDYRTDLYAAAVAFLEGDEYFVLRGRFD